MSALDDRIDDLYQQPLSEFIGARNALAKTLAGDDAKRVRALAKPTVVPWAVNQVYWRARGTYDRLMKSGDQVRKAQLAALQGKSADVRAANEAHRRAIGDAVREAERLAAPSGSKPSPDALMRTFEALSLASAAVETPGRLTGALQPAGFEALAGITPQLAVHSREVGRRDGKGAVKSGDDQRERSAESVGAGRQQRAVPAADVAKTKKEREREMREAREAREQEARETREREEAARQARARDAAIRQAEARLARVEAAEQQARAAWERAHDELLEARRAVATAKSGK